MPEKERVHFSLPEGMDPDTLIPIPLHCISDIFAWMAYTRVIHPQSAFAKDIETIRQAVWNANNGNKSSTDVAIEVGDVFIAIREHFLFPVLAGREIYECTVDKGDILEIEKIENAEDNEVASVKVHFRRYRTHAEVKKSYLTKLIRDRCIVNSGPIMR